MALTKVQINRPTCLKLNFSILDAFYSTLKSAYFTVFIVNLPFLPAGIGKGERKEREKRGKCILQSVFSALRTKNKLRKYVHLIPLGLFFYITFKNERYFISNV